MEQNSTAYLQNNSSYKSSKEYQDAFRNKTLRDDLEIAESQINSIMFVLGMGKTSNFGEPISNKSRQFNPINRGPIDDDIAFSFRSGTYTERVLTKKTTMYRIYGGRSKKVGQYLSLTKPKGGLQSQLDLALNPKWGNSVNKISKVKVPKGTTIYEGAAGEQNLRDSMGNIIGKLPGGGNQIYIEDIDARWFK